MGTVPKRFPLFFHVLICVALRLVSLAVAALLEQVPHSSAQQPGDDRTQIYFWEHMADILHVVAINLGIF